MSVYSNERRRAAFGRAEFAPRTSEHGLTVRTNVRAVGLAATRGVWLVREGREIEPV